MDVKNFIDLHVHIGPEIIPRKFSAEKLASEQTGKLGGVVAKNHFFPTTPIINGVDCQGDFFMVGSLVLNNCCGGLNPDAIFASAGISKTPLIVWFPTISAQNFLQESKYEIPPEWCGNKIVSPLANTVEGISIIENDKLSKKAKKVLCAIKKTQSILATGHISWKEAALLVESAVNQGIKNIIITHPIYQLIDMPLEIQKQLAKYPGVYIEQTYAMYLIDKIPIKKIANQIKEIGAENCILSSDMGQINSPSPSKALQNFCELLQEQGITSEELKMMGEENPKRILGI